MWLVDFTKHLYIKYTHKWVDYDLYLLTKHWKKTRAKAIKRADYKCQLCGSRKYSLQVHHNNYKCLYWEKRSDIIVLCSKCHMKFHGIDISNKRESYQRERYIR